MSHGADKANASAGHEEKVAMVHYRNLGITKADLDLYWNISPSK
jgi:hypothetical protein